MFEVRKWNRLILALVAMLTFAIVTDINLSVGSQPKTKAYEPNWESLAQHSVPEWLGDAKFGIYFHWGVYSATPYGVHNGKYSREMYIEGTKSNKYHKEHFGGPSQFGYKDFFPLFKAEKFDADEWIELFKKAGARFAGPIAIFHDGIPMWESSLTKWDVADMGPKRDIVGELAEAVRKQNMKFVCTFHHGLHWRYYEPSYTPDKIYDTEDTRYAYVGGLYPPPHEKGVRETEEYLKDWQAKVKEVIDKYQPDYLWFDHGWQQSSFEEYKKSLIAYYYNKAELWEKEVMVSYKDNHLPLGVGILDIERGKMDKLVDFPWMTDTSIDKKAWSINGDPEYDSVDTLVHNLVDIVSKNGNLLLSIAPEPDGTIPQAQRDRLLGLGQWLDVNGEAIYGTKPWIVYGQGAGRQEDQAISEAVEYTQNVRFTTKGKVLYAICLDWPGKELKLKMARAKESTNILMLGYKKPLEWHQNEDGLVIKIPKKLQSDKNRPCKGAWVFSIQQQ